MALMAGLAAAVAQVRVGAQSEDTPSIKEVMQKLHKGAKAPLIMVRKDVQANPPKWDEVKKLTKDFVILGAGLAKNDPPRGDKGHWTKLANQYFENAKAMDDAAQKEDKSAVLAARGKLTASCKACHDAHQERH
jgi:cytochrome c556